MMKVKRITGINGGPLDLDDEFRYAEVTIFDGKFELQGFCHPCNLEEGQEYQGFIGMDVEGPIVKARTRVDCLELLSEDKARFSARVVDKDYAYVGDLKLCVEDANLANFENGEYVSFIGYYFSVI